MLVWNYGRWFFVIMGLSGSGKSTLIRCLKQNNEPTSGKFLMIMILPWDKQRAIGNQTYRNEYGFQKFGLLPHRTILENAALDWIREKKGGTRWKKPYRHLKQLEGYEAQYPAEMSGGNNRVGLHVL
jgi:glycine betaine/proline transport system ATP-binding protein